MANIVMNGVDISSHQPPSAVNYATLKQNGIKFVILRAAMYGQQDTAFQQHYNKAKQAGLYVGAYYYVTSDKSGNYNTTDFCKPNNWQVNANAFNSAIQGKTFEMGLWLDYEPTDYAVKHGNGTSSTDRKNATNNAIGFCEFFEDKGYYVGIYGSESSVFKERYNRNDLNQYAWWVANYRSKEPGIRFAIWQYTAKGRVGGYNGDLDMNHCYYNIPNIIKNMNKGTKTSSGTTAKTVAKFQPRYSFDTFDDIRWNRFYSRNPLNVYYPTYAPSFVGGNQKWGNCTWYAYGRFLEIQNQLGKKDSDFIPAIKNKDYLITIPGVANNKIVRGRSSRDAGFWRFRVSDGLQTGTEPEIGAVLVIYRDRDWTNDITRQWAGHVCIVEAHEGNKWIYSESGYSSGYSGSSCVKRGELVYRQGKGWCNKWAGTGDFSEYKMWGFIYNPAIHGSNKGNPNTGSGGQPSDPEPKTQKYLNWITLDPTQTNPLQLSSGSMRINAIITFLDLNQRGFTRDSISAIIANLQAWSNINPATYDGFTEDGERDSPNRAYGLLQWSPPDVYLDWCDNNEYSPIDGDPQLLWIDMLFSDDTNQFWKPNSDPEKAQYYIPFLDFKQNLSNRSLEFLTKAFNYNLFDRSLGDMNQILQDAVSWKNYINGNALTEMYAHFWTDEDGIYPIADYETVNDGEQDGDGFVRGKKHLIFVEDNEPLLF